MSLAGPPALHLQEMGSSAKDRTYCGSPNQLMSTQGC